MDANRQHELEQKLVAGTITDAETEELLLACGNTPAVAKAASVSQGVYQDEEGALSYPHYGPERAN